MLDLNYQDTLLSKAIEGEAMSDLELRDFGEALLREPERAEEYLFARRLASDAAELPAARLSADFADGVMAALGEVEAPRVESSASPGWSWPAVAAAVVVATAGLVFWTPGGEIGEIWAGLVESTWFEWMDAFGGAAASFFSPEWTLIEIPLAAGAIFWLALGLPLLAGTMNYWSLRRLK